MSDYSRIEQQIENSSSPDSAAMQKSSPLNLIPITARNLVFSWSTETEETALWRIVTTIIDPSSQDRIVRIIKLNTKKYILFDIALKTFVELMQAGKIVRKDDPWPKHFIGRTPSEAAIKLRDRRLERVSRLIKQEYWLFRRRDLKEEIKEIAKEFHCSQRTIENDLRDYLQHGQIPLALMPLLFQRGKSGERVPLPGAKKRGRKSNLTKAKIKLAETQGKLIDPSEFDTGTNLTPRIRATFEVGYEMFVPSGLAKTDDDAYDLIILILFSNVPDKIDDLEVDQLSSLPSRAMYKKWRQKYVNPITHLINKVGALEYAKTFAPRAGNSTEMVEHSYQLWQTDVKKIRCKIYSELAPELMITTLSFCPYVDVFDHRIDGFYLGPENESQIVYLLAFHNATLSGFVPDGVFGDRGPLKGTRMEKPMRELSVLIMDAPPRRPDLKGLVESLLKKIEKLAFKLYAIKPGSLDKGDADYTLNVVLSYQQLHQLITLAIRAHNETVWMKNYVTDTEMDKDMVDKTPNEIRRWSMDVWGEPNYRPPELIQSLALLPTKGTIREDGLHLPLNKKLYDAPELEPIKQELAASKVKKHIVKDVRFDPSRMNSVQVILDDQPVECLLVDNRQNQKFKDRDLIEFKLHELHEALLENRNADKRFLESLKIKLEAMSVIAEQSPAAQAILKSRKIPLKQLQNVLNQLATIHQASSTTQPSVYSEDDTNFAIAPLSSSNDADLDSEDEFYEPDYSYLMRANRNLLDISEDEEHQE